MTPNQMNAAIPERRPATEEISGLIERVTFHNDENGFCVLRVKTPGRQDETTVIGSSPSVTAGEWLSAEGWWVRDKEHGLQFKASMTKTVPPTTAEGIERYLGSAPAVRFCLVRIAAHGLSLASRPFRQGLDQPVLHADAECDGGSHSWLVRTRGRASARSARGRLLTRSFPVKGGHKRCSSWAF
jgi:hypothetical protein